MESRVCKVHKIEDLSMSASMSPVCEPTLVAEEVTFNLWGFINPPMFEKVNLFWARILSP